MFAYCRNNPVDRKDTYGLKDTVCRTHTDGKNDRYYGTGVTKSKEDREKLDRIESCGKSVIRNNVIAYEITVTSGDYYFSVAEEKKKSLPGHIVQYCIVSLISVGIPYLAGASASLSFAAGTAGDLAIYASDSITVYPFEEKNNPYEKYTVTVYGYEVNVLSGEISPCTQKYVFAFSTNSTGNEIATLIDSDYWPSWR